MGKIPSLPQEEILEIIAAGGTYPGDTRQPTTAPPTSLTSFVTAVPPSSDLSAGQFTLWLDATPGATKLMIKAKDSGGTVRTGSVNLT